MPRFSIFTPLGHLRFSRVDPVGRRLFDAGAASLGGGRPGTYSLAREGGQRTFAWLYAWAMTLGSALLCIERASQQWDPERVTDLLELQEAERGSIPQAGWTIGQRRAQLARMRRLILDVSRNGTTNALDELLSSFLAYLPTAKADVVNWPSALGDSPMLLAAPTLPRRIATLASPISSVGSPVTVAYTERATGIEWQLQTGDTVVVEPENPDRAERVVLTAAFDTDGGPPSYITFTPTKSHAAGVCILRAPFPMWSGSKRHSLVILTAEGALDPEERRLAQWQMERYARATSTWDVAGANEDGESAGPFAVDEGLIGITPIGEVLL